MKRLLLFFLSISLLCVSLSGCAILAEIEEVLQSVTANTRQNAAQVIEYYATPGSAGYPDQWFRGKCRSCNRIFAFSAYEADKSQTTECLYCGATQNYGRALNRFVYDFRVAYAQAQYTAQQRYQYSQQQQMIMNYLRVMAQSQQRVAQYQNTIPAFQRGGIFNPIYIKLKNGY